MKYELKKRLNTENILSMQVLKSKHLRVAAYARVSTSFDDQRQSVESQKKHYTKKILENSNWELVGIYCDDGVSGTSVNGRAGFQELLRDVGKGKIDLILTKSVSRFARNTYDTIKYVRILREQKVAIYFEEENINTLDMNGELLISILSSIAQQESVNLSFHVKKGIQMKRTNGKPWGTAKCYGYSIDPDTKDYIVNQDEAEVIRLMVKLYLDGYGTTMVARILNERGIPGIKGRRWREETVGKLLKNEKIKGDICNGKYYSTDPITQKTKRNLGEKEMYYFHNHHEPIISPELWQKVNDEFKRRELLRNHKSSNECTKRYVFSGKLKCGFCGNSLNRLKSSILRDIKQICVLNKAQSDIKCEQSKLISTLVLEKAFMQAMNRLRNNIKLESKFSDRVNERIKYARQVLINTDEIDIEKFDEDLFSKLVIYYVVGGYDENGKEQPYLLRIIIKSTDYKIVEYVPEYSINLLDTHNKLIDFYSNQNFTYFEKDRKGVLQQKFVTRIRVQVYYLVED